MVGNVWDWTSGQQNSGAGRDNGTDGLWYGASFPRGTNNISAFKEDLLRAYPSSSALSTVADNADYYWYISSSRGSFRGGTWDQGSQAGRWTLGVNNAPSIVSAYLGMRCAF